MSKKLFIISIVGVILVLVIGLSIAARNKKQETASLEYFRVEKAVVGGWQSAEDSKYGMTIQENGKYADTYDNGVLGVGSWELLKSLQGVESRFQSLPDGLYLKKTPEGTEKSENLYYSVRISIDGNELELTYLARGNTLSFVRSR